MASCPFQERSCLCASVRYFNPDDEDMDMTRGPVSQFYASYNSMAKSGGRAAAAALCGGPLCPRAEVHERAEPRRLQGLGAEGRGSVGY